MTVAEGPASGIGKKIKWVDFLVVTADLNGTVVEVDELLKEKGLKMTFV